VLPSLPTTRVATTWPVPSEALIGARLAFLDQAHGELGQISEAG